MYSNQTAAGLALAAAHNINLAGCSVAAASGIPLVSAGCSLQALDTLSSTQQLSPCLKYCSIQTAARCMLLMSFQV